MSRYNSKDFTGPPFDLYIPSADATLQFSDYPAVREWATKQKKLWAPASKLAKVHSPLTKQAYNSIASFFDKLSQIRIPADGQAIETVKQQLTQLGEGIYPTADSPIGLSILEGIDKYPRTAAARMVWAVQAIDGFTHPISADFLVTLINVRIEDQIGHTEPRIQKARLTKLFKEWQGRLEDMERKFRNQFDYSIRASKDQLHEVSTDYLDHADEWARIKRTFEEDIRLKAPASYWAERAQQSLRTANTALLWFFGISGFSVVALAFIFPFVFEQLTSMGSGFNLAPTVLITLPAILLLWFLRLIARRHVNSLATARDAQHRQTMIQTYLALMAEEGSGVTEQDRLLILQALFRPENPSGDDDAPPPHLLEIMTKAAGKGK